MDPILIVLGIALLVILYEIYGGEIISSMKYGVRKINRKTQPAKYWLNIGVQLVIWTLFVLFQLGKLPIK